MISMKKGFNSFFVSLIALILAAPIAGVSSTFVYSDSQLLFAEEIDLARSSYGVNIEFYGDNTGFESLTRNEFATIAFLISNTGSLPDTYNLSISWEENDLGWFANSSRETITIDSGDQEIVDFNFQTPIQDVYDESQMTFTLRATSQNDTSVISMEDQVIDIEMTYAVDIELRQGDSKAGNRGDSLSYSVRITNSGNNPDNFTIATGVLPKDWIASTSISSIDLDPGVSHEFEMAVSIPSTAAVDEYALIEVIARVQESNYNYIYGFGTTNTTVEDGRVYDVEIVSDFESKQVIPGSMIIYDLSITNSGDETDSFALTITSDDEEGWLSNLSQFEIDDLGPDETYTVVLTIYSPEDSEEEDSLLTAIYINSKSREQFDDDLEVNTIIRIPERGVSLSSPQDTLNGNPGSTLTYTISVMNTGSDPDDINLGFEICDSCNAWVVSLSKYTIVNLANGNSEDVQMLVKVPSSARATDEASFTFTAESHDDSAANADIDVISTVNTVYNQNVISSTVPTMYPGNINQFNVTIINNGNSVESYKISEGYNVPSDWKFDDTLIFETQDLNPFGGTETFTLPFEVPQNENPGYYNFSIDIKLSSSGIKVDSIDLSVKIEYYANFTISIASDQSIGDPGFTHQFAVTINNNANADDEIDLIVDGLPSTWTYCVLFSGNCLNSLNIAKGATTEFILEIATPDIEAANTNGLFLNLVGTSSLNNKFETSQSFKIMTNPTYLFSVDIPSDAKTGVSGDTIPFQLTIKNIGNDVDYITLPSPTLPSGWIGTYTESSFTLQPQDSKTVYLNVQVPANVFGGNSTITSKISSDQSNQMTSIDFTVYVEEKADIDVELKTTAGDVTAGLSGSFRVLITNNGNTVETLSLTLEGKRSSWFTLPKETLSLEPGSYEEIMVEVRPPVTQAASDTSGILNVTLSSDSSKSVKLTLPFSVLKSDLIDDTVVEEEEDSPLPSLGLISTILIITIISFSRKKKF